MSDINFSIEEVSLNFGLEEVNLNFSMEEVGVTFTMEEVELSFPQTVENINFGITEQTLHFTLSGVGLPGPQGPAGVSEAEMDYARRSDVVDENADPVIIYKAQAVPGTLNSADKWRISRLSIAADDDVTEEWADGNSNFDKIWDNRASYTYS